MAHARSAPVTERWSCRVAATALGAALLGLAGAPAAEASTAYVTNWVTTSVTPVNLVSSMAGTPIAVGEKSWGVAITPDGKTAYVSVTESNTVTPITVATNTAGTPIAVGKRPEKLAIAADGDTAYVGNWISGDGVTPINLATNTAGTPITVAGKPISIAIVPDQGPLAAFSASAAPAGAATTLNAWRPPIPTARSQATRGASATATAQRQARRMSRTYTSRRASTPRH
jgi:YVTN family beta-propeller protein